MWKSPGRAVDEDRDPKAHRRMVDVVRASDAEALPGLTADDVVWHLPGNRRPARCGDATQG